MKESGLIQFFEIPFFEHWVQLYSDHFIFQAFNECSNYNFDISWCNKSMRKLECANLVQLIFVIC